MPPTSQHEAHLRCLGCWSSCSDSEFSSLRRGSLLLPAPPLPPGPATPAEWKHQTSQAATGKQQLQLAGRHPWGASCFPGQLHQAAG